MGRNVYTYTYSQGVAAGGAQTQQFNIDNNLRTMQILSILFDYQYINGVTGEYYNINNEHPDLRHILTVGFGVVSQATIGRSFRTLAGVGVIVWNGQAFDIRSGGQYTFNSFFVPNELAFQVVIQARAGGVAAWTSVVSLVVEVDDEIKYSIT